MLAIKLCCAEQCKVDRVNIGKPEQGGVANTQAVTHWRCRPQLEHGGRLYDTHAHTQAIAHWWCCSQHKRKLFFPPAHNFQVGY